MELRDAVHANHKRAEDLEFSKLLVAGNLTPNMYIGFLANIHEVYAELERDNTISNDDVKRADAVRNDLNAMVELYPQDNSITIARSVQDYVTYLSGLSAGDRWAHIYVQYTGNMYGGQLIAKQLSSKDPVVPHSYLKFENRVECIAYIRSNIVNVDHAEANTAFDWIIRIYDELYQLFG